MSHAKISSQADAVAHLINALGFTPTSSVALHLLTDGQVLASLRVDVVNAQDARPWAVQIASLLARIDNVTGVILISFENERVMTDGQYEELGDQLARIGAPIVRTIRVAEGEVMDYDGDRTDAVSWDEVQTSPVGMDAHLQLTKPLRQVEDLPEYDDRLTTEIDQQAEILTGYDFTEFDQRDMLREQFAELVTEYQRTQQVTDQMIAWIGGAMCSKATRDMLTASTATSDMSWEKITDALVGDAVVEDQEFFDDAMDLIFHCAHYLYGEEFAHVLCVLGWGHWTTGRGSLGRQFILKASQEEPGHRLSELLGTLINQGKLPATALRNPHAES